MKCFLRTNSPEIRSKLEESGLIVCACCSFPTTEWLVYSGVPPSVHGVFPGNDEEEWGTEGLFGNKDTFKDVFLSNHKDYIDCGENVGLFIETIKKLTEASMSQYE